MICPPEFGWDYLPSTLTLLCLSLSNNASSQHWPSAALGWVYQIWVIMSRIFFSEVSNYCVCCAGFPKMIQHLCLFPHRSILICFIPCCLCALCFSQVFFDHLLPVEQTSVHSGCFGRWTINSNSAGCGGRPSGFNENLICSSVQVLLFCF